MVMHRMLYGVTTACWSTCCCEMSHAVCCRVLVCQKVQTHCHDHTALLCMQVHSTLQMLQQSSHLSAHDSTVLTHSQRMDHLHKHNPLFRTTNEKYGQRMSLEQVLASCILISAQLLGCNTSFWQDQQAVLLHNP